MAPSTPHLPFKNPAVFVCDIQEAFRPSIYEFDKVIKTTTKLLRATTLLKVPTFVTTQNRQKLGNTVPELQPLLSSGGVAAAVDADKTRFSMWIDPVSSHPVFDRSGRNGTRGPMPPAEVAIVGIESHICVTQTALDLLAAGHKVYVLADGVSSSNREEVGVALARMRAAGAVITTSESWIYELLGDSADPEFRGIVKLVKETMDDTRGSLQGLLGAKI